MIRTISNVGNPIDKPTPRPTLVAVHIFFETIVFASWFKPLVLGIDMGELLAIDRLLGVVVDAKEEFLLTISEASFW
jgi:hypothetical protein